MQSCRNIIEKLIYNLLSINIQFREIGKDKLINENTFVLLQNAEQFQLNFQ
jgi:hypothetical protein